VLRQAVKRSESIRRYGSAVGLVTAGILIIGGVLFWWFGTPLSAKNQSGLAAQQAIPVTAGTAQARDVPVFIEGLGTVQAFNRVNVVTRVSGEIVKVFFREGQEVKAGDKLFQIDPRQFAAALQQAQAAKEKDEAQLQSAELDLQRYTKLLPQGFQTRQAYDQQLATVAQLQAAVKADQAQIESAQLNVGYSLIRSPIDGRTGQRMVDVGNFVQTGQNSPLVNITQIKPIFVSFSVPADRLDAIRKNQALQPLKVIAYAMDDKTVLTDGILTLIDNRVDAATGTIHLKAKFANTHEPLWPGQSVNAHLILAVRKNAVTVPAQTVMQGPDGAYVYVLNRNDIAKRHKVDVATTQDGIAVIGRGLQAGTRVVVDGQYRLTNGSKVKIGPAQAAQSGSKKQAER
jgi:membrane fusion protein, multidrug efflux system